MLLKIGGKGSTKALLRHCFHFGQVVLELEILASRVLGLQVSPRLANIDRPFRKVNYALFSNTGFE